MGFPLQSFKSVEMVCIQHRAFPCTPSAFPSALVRASVKMDAQALRHYHESTPVCTWRFTLAGLMVARCHVYTMRSFPWNWPCISAQGHTYCRCSLTQQCSRIYSSYKLKLPTHGTTAFFFPGSWYSPSTLCFYTNDCLKHGVIPRTMCYMK
jgi:hypothetical protein